jgi:hypothetical protein
LQARGLPHAHILIILENKILCARQVDAIISAEVPNPVTQPRLHAIVSKNMIHKPCDLDAAAGCVVKGKGKCCRRYPKPMHAITTTNGDGYPQYRRRGLHTTRIGDRVVTDDWVVPHNPYLLVRFNCHINCEVSSHKRCFKYVYKYVFKVRSVYRDITADVDIVLRPLNLYSCVTVSQAPDHAVVELNEIRCFLSGRLLTASEAAWRLLGLKLHQELPPVFRLDVHLPYDQQMIFDPTHDPLDILEAAERSSSTLLEWFALNVRDPEARQYKYSSIPEHYVWKQGVWFRRERLSCMSVGRMFGVSPCHAELFALRSLLDCVSGD